MAAKNRFKSPWSSESQGIYSPHQDATYTGLEPPERCLSVWVALSDPVGEREGYLEFLKIAHEGGQAPHIHVEETSTTTICCLEVNLLKIYPSMRNHFLFSCEADKRRCIITST
jgi:hypothetical protein